MAKPPHKTMYSSKVVKIDSKIFTILNPYTRHSLGFNITNTVNYQSVDSFFVAHVDDWFDERLQFFLLITHVHPLVFHDALKLMILLIPQLTITFKERPLVNNGHYFKVSIWLFYNINDPWTMTTCQQRRLFLESQGWLLYKGLMFEYTDNLYILTINWFII